MHFKSRGTLISTENIDWSIGELGSRAGLNPSAIRYYERLGLLPQAQRVGGKRRYDHTALTRLAVIDVAQRAGFTLAETRTLLQGFSHKTPPPAPSTRAIPSNESRAASVRVWLARGDQSALVSDRHESGAVVAVQLAQDVAHMGLDGQGTDEHPAGDLVV